MRLILVIVAASFALVPGDADAIFRTFRKSNGGGCANGNRNRNGVNVNVGRVNASVNRNGNQNKPKPQNNNQNNSNQSAADDRDGEVIDRLNELQLLAPFAFANANATSLTQDDTAVNGLKDEIAGLKQTIDDLKNTPPAAPVIPVPQPEPPKETPATGAPAASPEPAKIFYNIERRTK